MKLGRETRLEGLRAARDLGVADSLGLGGIETIQTIVKLAKYHNTIQENKCNGEISSREKAREESLETRIAALAVSVGLSASFQGDPRGFTVRLHNGAAFNTFGGLESGYGVGE